MRRAPCRFDPGTVEKIHILSSTAELQEFMPLANIPKEYGGELDWTYGQAPALGEVERAKLGEDGDRLQGPICWDRDAGRVLFLGKDASGKQRNGQGEGAAAGSISAVADGSAVKSPSQTVKDANESAEAAANKPASKDSKPLMASFIPSDGTPGSLVHSTANGNGAPLVDSPSSEAPPANERHFANGTSPANDPPHPPETGYVPGTHEPLTEERVRARSLPPAAGQASALGQEDGADKDDDGSSKTTDEQAGRIRNEAVAKGWIPGSGVTEQDFLRSVGGMTL